MARLCVSLFLAVWAGAVGSAAAQQKVLSFTAADDASNKEDTANTASWHRYVRAPAHREVSPVGILPQFTAGNVSNPSGLVGASTGVTTLSRFSLEDDAVVPTIVVDFGQVVAGLLTVDFSGAVNISAAYPGLTLAFSETLQYLGDRSDFTRSDNAGANRLTDGTDQIAVRPRPYTWIDQLGCEYGSQVCADGLHGFRYVKIRLDALPRDAPYTSALGSVSIAAVRLRYAGYLGTPDTFAGYFECSDPNITQWWYDGVYTNDLCTDVFHANDTEPRNAASKSLMGKLVLLDGPKRDRDPYVGDLAVAALTTYLSHSDVSEAAGNVLEDLALHQRDDGWIPPASINAYTLPLFDYPLWWVVCSADYVMYTGNMTYLEAYYPALLKVLDRYYPAHTNADTGLVERPGGTGDYAFLPRTGAVTYYNALYVQALTKAAALADAADCEDDAARWRSRAAAIGPALLRRNFDDSVGAFFDGASCDGRRANSGSYYGSKSDYDSDFGDDSDYDSDFEDGHDYDSDYDSDPICPTHSQDGNSLAILAGIVPTGPSANTTLAESILAYLSAALARPYGNAFFDNSLLDPGADFGHRVYAFISYFEIAARFAAAPATAPSALEELRRLYGWMATHDPTVTFWEGIGPNGSPYEGGFTSMAHAWSSGVVPLLSNYVLGVTPTAPGFREWDISPVMNLPGITWASGLVPTPGGGIWVRWDADWEEAVGGEAGRGVGLSKDGDEEQAATDEDRDEDRHRRRHQRFFRLVIKTPQASHGRVTLPLPPAQAANGAVAVAVDGVVVHTTTSGKKNKGHITLTLAGGRHTITVTVI